MKVKVLSIVHFVKILFLVSNFSYLVVYVGKGLATEVGQ